MINYNEEKQRATLTIPAYAFIACLSHPFHNRQKQLTYVTTTSIFSTEFRIYIEGLEKMISQIVRKTIIINIIVSENTKEKLENSKDLILSGANYKNLIFNVDSLDDLAYKLSTPNYSSENNYYIFIGFDS